MLNLAPGSLQVIDKPILHKRFQKVSPEVAKGRQVLPPLEISTKVGNNSAILIGIGAVIIAMIFLKK